MLNLFLQRGRDWGPNYSYNIRVGSDPKPFVQLNSGPSSSYF